MANFLKKWLELWHAFRFAQGSLILCAEAGGFAPRLAGRFAPRGTPGHLGKTGAHFVTKTGPLRRLRGPRSTPPFVDDPIRVRHFLEEHKSGELFEKFATFQKSGELKSGELFEKFATFPKSGELKSGEL